MQIGGDAIAHFGHRKNRLVGFISMRPHEVFMIWCGIIAQQILAGNIAVTELLVWPLMFLPLSVSIYRKDISETVLSVFAISYVAWHYVFGPFSFYVASSCLGLSVLVLLLPLILPTCCAKPTGEDLSGRRIPLTMWLYSVMFLLESMS